MCAARDVPSPVLAGAAMATPLMGDDVALATFNGRTQSTSLMAR
jgi:hypothetical protein